MRRTVRQPGRDRLLVAAFWILVLIIAVVPTSSGHMKASPSVQIVGALLLAAALAAMALLTLHLFLTRAVIEKARLTLYALRRRECLSIPLDGIVGYHKDGKGDWWIHCRPEGTACTDLAERTRVAVGEPWELHRFFLETAPKKLGVRRWRFTGTPPSGEFRNLWVFDVERFTSRAFPQLAGMMTGCLIGFLLSHHRNTGAYGQFLGILFIPAILIWERLDVTHEGLVYRSPIHRRIIHWSEAKAIFQEGPKGKRSFVVVGPNCAIHIPAHLAIDRDLIEKVLYSLPDPILCINFDETSLRGYRRRKKAREKAPSRSEDLLPLLTG